MGEASRYYSHNCPRGQCLELSRSQRLRWFSAARAVSGLKSFLHFFSAVLFVLSFAYLRWQNNTHNSRHSGHKTFPRSSQQIFPRVAPEGVTWQCPNQMLESIWIAMPIIILFFGPSLGLAPSSLEERGHQAEGEHLVIRGILIKKGDCFLGRPMIVSVTYSAVYYICVDGILVDCK